MQALETVFAHGSTQPVADVRFLDANSSGSITLRCPACRNELAALSYHELGQAHEPLNCTRCAAALPQQEGIWRALPEERSAYFQRFIREYEEVRRAEGRGSDGGEFYLALPFRDSTGRNNWQWSIRARTFSYLEREILPALRAKRQGPLSVLDLGAGNGWMSYRLALQGYWPTAVDLQSNTYDGLGAAIHYQSVLPRMFPRFQAELDRLPFEDDQFDCAVFNASFHYSENYDATLGEAIRCLRPGGTVVIADSPYYIREDSGRQMLDERRKHFQSHFGFSSDALSSCEYLTGERLLGLEARHDIEWITHRVWYGVRWACRPWIARFKKRREPSQFRIYTARVKTR